MKSACSISHRLFLLLGGLSVILGPASATFADVQSESKLVNHVKVQAFADAEAITPGKVLQLAVKLEPEEGWHLYWRGAGGTGMPTVVTWQVPSGFEVGRTQFPSPEAKEIEYDAQNKETCWLLPDKAVLMTPIRVPESAGGGNVTLKVAASWLACKKECIPGNVELSLSLPIAAKGTSPKPANEDLFKNAIASYPTPAAKAEHVKITCTAQRDPIKPGDKFQVVLTAELEAKHHMQSHKPFIEDLIPAVVFIEPTDGFEYSDVIYPQAQEREDKILGKLSEYEGKVQFKIPAELSKDADKSVRWVRGVLQYQICTDAGTCYPPAYSEFEIPVRIQGGPPASKAFSFTRPNVEVSHGKGPAKSEPPKTEAPKASDSTVVESATTAAPASSWSNRFFVSLNRFQDWLLTFGYAGALMVAFIGGFVLNLMPCVLPVISLKVLSFVRQAHEHRLRVFFLGLAYAAGILVFFGVLAVLFAKFGKGWGELAQYPQVNLILAGVVTAFAMSLFGVFAVFTPRIINKLDEKVEGEGFASAFATGVLATVLGTACTAPFLSAAIGAASRFTPIQGAGIFMMSGVGMAFPYVMLAANPKWLRFVPKPGKWMGVFEGLMGFLLLGTAIWLLNPLRGQIGDFGVLLSLVFLVMIALAVWIKGKIEWGASLQKRVSLYSLAIVVVLLSWVIPFKWIATIDGLMKEKENEEQLIAEAIEARRGELDWSKGIPWRRYTRERVLQDVKNGYTVFIDYTADWCINCKTILKVVIDTPEVIALMKQNKVIPYEADYTRPVQEIKEDLARYGRGGVPVQVVYKPNDPANPNAFQAFDQQTLLNALKEAGPSKAAMMTKATNP